MSLIKRLPKIELHAHLNGSLSEECIDLLLKAKNDPDLYEERDNLPKNKLDRDTFQISDFFSLFSFIFRLTDTPETLYMATTQIIKEFHLDNVHYLELRSTPKTTPFLTKTEYVQTIINAINDCQLPIVVRLILSLDRRHSLETCLETVGLAKQFKGVVVGIDLCGDPTIGNFEDIKPAIIKAKEYSLKVTLHLGEIDTPDEVRSMLATIPDRIGHGTFIPPDLFPIVVANNIPIEICMTSNVLCKTVKSYDAHHVKEYFFNQGHPCVFCTDDVGIFGSSLTNEYQIASQVFKLDYKELFEMSRKSLEWIFEDDEKVIKGLHTIWNDFEKEHLQVLFKDSNNTLNTQ